MRYKVRETPKAFWPYRVIDTKLICTGKHLMRSMWYVGAHSREEAEELAAWYEANPIKYRGEFVC
jgi:hypothetical protein